MNSNLRRRVVVEIDLDALVRNYRRIVSHVKPMDVLCVLKANAYGLGVGAYAKALIGAGCRSPRWSGSRSWFSVTSVAWCPISTPSSI